MKIRNKFSILLALLTVISAFLHFAATGFAWGAAEGGP